MKIRYIPLISNFVLLALITIMLLNALSFSGNAKNFPLLIGIPTWLMLFILSVNEFRRMLRGKFGSLDMPKASEILKVISVLVAYIAMVFLFGFYLAIIGFMILFFVFYRGTSWWKMLLLSVSLSILIYLLATFVQTDLYTGILFAG